MYSSVGKVLREAETAYTNNALQLVEKARKKHPGLQGKKIAFAYVDLPNPNAQAFFVDNDKSYGIAVDHSLFGLYTDIMTGSMALHARPKLRRQEFTAMFTSRMRHLLSRPVANTNEERVAMSRAMETFYRATQEWHEEFRFPEYFARWFVVAHELAHIALGHLERGPGYRRTVIAEHDIPATITTSVHESEFAADLWALDLLTEAFTPGDNPEGEFVLMVNARLFFEAMYFLRMFLPRANVIGGDVYGETHPPPDVRIERVKAFCPAFVKEIPEQYREFWKYCDVIRGWTQDRRIQFAARKIQADLAQQVNRSA
jgi:hypothetical protein